LGGPRDEAALLVVAVRLEMGWRISRRGRFAAADGSCPQGGVEER
jgi:hypothetical protein